MYVMVDGLTRLMAPILSFTADELWRRLPGVREESVHMALFPARESLSVWFDESVTARWDALGRLRERVLAEIEPLRKDKQIGSSLQAKVILTVAPPELDRLERMATDLPMLFIVSEVELRTGSTDPGAAGETPPGIEITRAGGVKCDRCWRYVPSVSSDPEWAGLCPRCQSALAEPIHG
jgi:isoleucyl-tRNA synthetase